jgi:hypothetical protein
VAVPPTPVARTRPSRARQRRAIAVALVCVVAVGAVVALAFSSTSHHVRVVRVVTVKRPVAKVTPSAASTAQVAPGAPSDRQVEQELHKAEATGTGGTGPGSPGTGTGSGGSALSPGATASFAALRRSLPEQVEIAVAPLGSQHIETLGGDDPAHGWSTTKVPVLAALIKARGSSGLTTTEQALAESAITASDNESILSLFSDLERIKGGLVGASRYVQSLFALSGDPNTIVATAPPPAGASTTFGQTLWTPADSARFFSALARGCLLSSGRTSYVLGLMQNIEASESWGLGSAGFHSVAFKGGWGPEPSGGYLVRQSGIVDVGTSRAVAVAIVATPSSGSSSFSTGTEVLDQAALWLRRELRPRPGAPSSCSGESAQ